MEGTRERENENFPLLFSNKFQRKKKKRKKNKRAKIVRREIKNNI